MKKIFYTLVGSLALLKFSTAGAALDIGIEKAATLKGGTADTVDLAITTFVVYLTSFLALVAVLYAIWGGFTILTAAGDEEKVKKGRTVIFHAILGIIVILLAYAIINWVVGAIVKL